MYEDCEKYEGEELEQCSKDVHDYRAAMDEENWALCARLYANAGIPTYHRDHSHDKMRASTKRTREAWVKDDLLVNRCRALIPKDYWAEY